ncbi:vWA domain-containing protein [Kitasatospora sp. NPDC050543]|uniref:vWA domain-containing protein n=1 Tax=Kitasatospora sp. NPDC050543 TaxID=3364054 RepID=UPI00379D8CC4
MSAPLLSMTSHRLLRVPEGGPISGQQVGVNAADLPPGTPATGLPVLLSLDAGGEPLCAALRLSALAEVPTGVLALGEELAGSLGLDEIAGPQNWRIDQVPVVPLRRLRLEMATETSLDAAVRDLSEAGLPGRLLWLPDEPGRELWLEIGGLPHRVQEADAGGRRGVLAEIGPQSEVELFASGARNGVDIVVLADCSGSMDVDDIPVLGETAGGGLFGGWRRGARPSGRQKRAEALRQALQYLLEMRLQVSGRESRLALVQFTHTTRQVFPRGGGMAELDAGSAGTAAEEFRGAVALLRPESAGTDIGNALHEAANLLYQHGKPGNEKLVVLVSDGAHWAPKGDQGLGEVVRAAEEPVSLMEHLHRDMGVRLHALGISTPALYQQWVRAGHVDFPDLEPNHGLLEQLVRVGGGDTAAIGGFDVLAHYFSGLGTGTVRRVPLHRGTDGAARTRPGAGPGGGRGAGPGGGRGAGALARETVELLRALSERQERGRRQAEADAARGVPAGAPAAAEYAGRLREAAGRVHGQSQRVFGRPLLDVRNLNRVVTRSVVGEDGHDPRHSFVRDLTGAFRPTRPAVVPPELAVPLGALEQLLMDTTAQAAQDATRADSPGWRAERVGALTGVLEALAAALAAASEVPQPVAAQAAGSAGSASGAAARERAVPQREYVSPPVNPYGAGATAIGANSPAAQSAYPPAPTAAPTAAPVPVSATLTLRYRGEE